MVRQVRVAQAVPVERVRLVAMEATAATAGHCKAMVAMGAREALVEPVEKVALEGQHPHQFLRLGTVVPEETEETVAREEVRDWRSAPGRTVQMEMAA